MDNPNKKRLREQDDNISDHGHGNSSFPRFLLIECVVPEEPLSKLSPFVIQKVLVSVSGSPKSVKKLNSGALLVEVEKPRHAENLLKINRFHLTPAKCTPHGSLNKSRGIIRCPDLAGVSVDEIVAELSSQMFLKLAVYQSGETVSKEVQTQLFLLFEQPFYQKTLKVGYLNVGVDIYIPNPLQCYSCFKFGHHERKCRLGVGDRLCRRCGDPANDHEESDCNRKPKCVNCGGDHMSTSRACDFWRREKEIVTVKHKESLSFPEARKIVEARHVLPNSYSSVLKTKKIEVKDANTQTIDITEKPQVKENISKDTKAPANRQSLQAKRTDSSEEKINNFPKKQK